MDFNIYWYAKYTLYSDRVEVWDVIYDTLEPGNYQSDINAITFTWRDYSAIEYHFLWDEPNLDQLESFKFVQNGMGENGDPITQVAQLYKKHYGYNIYSDFINMSYGNATTPLLVHNYPLKPGDATQSEIDYRFDTLCLWMDNVREIADTTGSGRDVWYACQGHGIKTRAGEDTILRSPTPQEMWALVGLGLAHGAKGILYFAYASRYYSDSLKEDSLRYYGLVEYSDATVGWVNTKKWDATQNVNQVLQKIDEFLLDFDFQNAFSGGDVPQSYIKSTSFDTTELGLFEDSDDLKYFLAVSRRDTFSTVADTASDSTLITLGLDGSLHSGHYYIRDCYSGEPYGYDSTSSGEAPEILYFSFYLKDCHFKLFQIVPFACDVEINADSSYTDYAFVKLCFNTITALDSIDTLRMTVWDDEGDTLSDVLFDSTIIWEFDSTGTKVISASFEIISDDYIHADSGYLTPTYCDTIFLDTIPPSGNSIDVVDVDTLEGFVNEDSVDLELESTDASSPPVKKMRFSNYSFDNVVQNPEFASSANWTCTGSASIDSGYGEIDADAGGVIYQDIDDTLLVEDQIYQLYAYVVTDSFVSDSGRIRFQYMYVDTTQEGGDTTYSTLKIIALSDGDQALTGYNSISDTFTYDPICFSSDTALGIRLEIHQNNAGDGTIYVDNFLLDRYYSESVWHDYDTTYSDWITTSGNGEKTIWAEYRDAAGNISSPVSDTIILDATNPIKALKHPQDQDIIGLTVTIKGWAYDSADADSHNYYYQLQYQPSAGGAWNDCDSTYYYAPKYPNTGSKDPSVPLGTWNTMQVQDGYYFLRLTVVDLASNSVDTTITVEVGNCGKRGSGEFSAGKEPAGIGSYSNLYITDSDQGELLKYKETGDSIGYCELEKDSLGIGKPCAVATDSNGFWIADRYNHTVIYYENGGDPKYKIGAFGDEKGEFNEPSGIALWDKKVYVTDRYNHRVQVFKDDEYLFEFGSKGDSAGQFIEPLGITIDKYGWVYVVDRGNNRIQAFDTTGSFIEIFAKDVEFKNPCGIVADTFGYLFVVDQENFRVVELDPFGDPICEFGEKGDEEGEFLEPFDVAISENGEKLFVTDTNRKKVVKFDICIEDSGGPMSSGEEEIPIINCLKACYPVPFNKGTNISYAIANKGHVSIKVYDITGRLIKKLVQGTQDRGWHTIGWDGHNQNAKSVAAGVYFIRMETESFLSTKKVLLVR